MRKILISIITFSIMIGIIALAMNTAFGNQTITYIEKVKYTTGQTHFYYYHFTWWRYIQNLQLTTTDTSILIFELQPRQWQQMTATNFGEALGNNLALMVNEIIMAINILLYPLKLGAYILRNFLAILGINQDTTNQYNGLAWLVVFVRDILSNIAIPYI